MPGGGDGSAFLRTRWTCQKKNAACGQDFVPALASQSTP